MKRGGPLKRTKALKSKTHLKSATPLKQGSGPKPGGSIHPQQIRGASSKLRRTKLRQVSKRKGRERKAEERFREAVLARASGRCECCTSGHEVEAHHVVPRGRARGHPLLHDPRNGAALCFRCHTGVHSAKDLEDRDKWLKPARALDDMEPGKRLAEVDPAVTLAIQGLTNTTETHFHEGDMRQAETEISRLTYAPRLIEALNAARRTDGPSTIHLLHRGVRYQIGLRDFGAFEGQAVFIETSGAWTHLGTIEVNGEAEVSLSLRLALDPDGAREALAMAEQDLDAALESFYAQTDRCGLCNTPLARGFAHPTCLERFGRFGTTSGGAL